MFLALKNFPSKLFGLFEKLETGIFAFLLIAKYFLFMRKFRHLVYAGTFDRLHIGHKKLLSTAFELGEKVAIGITGKKMSQSKPLANLILTYEVRRRAVEQYLDERNWLKRARFFRIDDIYGPAIVDKSMDSILVSKFTQKNAEKINEIRVKRNLKPLKIIVAPLVRGDDGEVVTSERIRMGEIDREGHVYQINKYTNKQIANENKERLILPNYLRREMRKPLGKVIKGSENQLEKTAKKIYRYIDITICQMVITVGDIVTMSMFKIGFDPDVKIIDLRSRRKDIEMIDSGTQFLSHESLTTPKSAGPLESEKIAFASSRYINDPGTINIKTAGSIKRAIDENFKTGGKQLIVVKGEEDLLALPAVLFAPLQSIVLYGQMDLGVVLVEVTEEKKREVEEILRKFK